MKKLQKRYLKPLLKAVTRSRFGQRLIASIGFAYIKGVLLTSRVHIEGLHHFEDLLKSNTSFITCFWHAQLLLMPHAWRFSKPFYMLISDHADGHIIAKVIDMFGIETVYGSTGKDGVMAVRKLLAHLAEGRTIGITPDGPRGPAEIVGDGTIFLAKRSQSVLVPLTCKVKKAWRLRTWDRFIIPKFFNTIEFCIHEPLDYEKDAEALKNALRTQLNEVA